MEELEWWQRYVLHDFAGFWSGKKFSKVGKEVGDACVTNGIGRVLLCQVLQVMQCPDDVFELLYLLFVCEGWSGRYE